MSFPADLDRFQHDLGIVNIDGVVYKAFVEYFDEDGQKLRLSEDFIKQECSITGQVKKQFDNYVSAVARDHVKHVGKELKDTHLIVINTDEVKIDGEVTKGHDFELSEESKTQISTKLHEEIHTVASTWKKTHDILMNDFDAHITAATTPRLSFTGELDDSIRPHHAQLTLHRRDEDELSEPPLYEDLSPSAPVVVQTEARRAPVKEPLLTSSPVDLSSPVVNATRTKHILDPSLSAAPIKPLAPVTVMHAAPLETHNATLEHTAPLHVDLGDRVGSAPVVKAGTLPEVVSVKAPPVRMPPEETRTAKPIAELLAELDGSELSAIKGYLQYFHPFHLQTVIEGYKRTERKEEFIAMCEKLKLETEARAKVKKESNVMLATDDALLSQVATQDRAAFKRQFKAIDKMTIGKHVVQGSAPVSISEEEIRKQKQVEKAKLVQMHVRTQEEAKKLLATHSVAEHSARLQQLNALHEAQLATLSKEKDEEPVVTEKAVVQPESNFSIFKPWTWVGSSSTPQEVEAPKKATKPLIAEQSVKAPVIMIHDEVKREFSVLTTNSEELKPQDEDVKARARAVRSYVQQPSSVDRVVTDFMASMESVHAKRAPTTDGKTTIDQIIERYQLHIGVLEAEHRQLAEAADKTSSQIVDEYIELKAKLDTEFKKYILMVLEDETPAAPATFFKAKKKKGQDVLTDEASTYVQEISTRYLNATKKMQTLGNSFRKIYEALLDQGRSTKSVNLDDVSSSATFIFSVLKRKGVDHRNSIAVKKAIGAA